MRKKIFILIIVFLIILIIYRGYREKSNSPNDLYGTWVYTEIGTLGGQNKMEYIITASTFTITFTFEITNSFSPPSRTVFEIFSWERISNEDTASRGDYPSGFLLGLKSVQANDTAKLFIHRNKKSLISVYQYNGGFRRDIYIKQ